MNGFRLVYNWQNPAVTEISNTVTLVAGQKYHIIVHYFENTGEAVVKLYWSIARTHKQ